jgi:hypothetical protein
MNAGPIFRNSIEEMMSFSIWAFRVKERNDKRSRIKGALIFVFM